MCIKSQSLIFPVTNKLGGVFEQNFGLGGGNFNKPIFKGSNAWGVGASPGGMLKLQIDPPSILILAFYTFSPCK